MCSKVEWKSENLTVGIAIPTFNAQATLGMLLERLSQQTYKEYKLLIVDSTSTDGTLRIASEFPCNVLTISKADFNHGATRELARNTLDTDIVIFLTQDAIPNHPECIERLIMPLIADDDIAISYARQLPRPEADVFESFPRDYNYGNQSQLRGIEDVGRYGVYTFFCSNSCAAYKNTALNAVSGFESVLTNEDYFAVAKMLQRGFKISYVADSMVVHSHRYSLLEEFQRYFDTGYVRAQRQYIQDLVGEAEGRGVGFVGSLLKLLLKKAPGNIPYAILQSGVKWLGYRIGYFGRPLPRLVKKKFSQQKNYWDSIYCD